MATELQQYESNKKLVRSNFEQLWNEGEYGLIEEICTDAYAAHEPMAGDMDRDEFEAFVRGVHAGFPDVHFEIEDILAEGDEVFVRYIGTGTHDGEFMGIDGTGRKVTVPGMALFRLDDGKIAESWSNWDAFAMLSQLGLLPDELSA
ncbi:ester cyclase [Halorussus halophilus]|uniref:ester cyclase n=1 Tax=Halorussus halophilus TaxID=2650975 RepID=UPI0013011300|nr:ester cyclase [Halorussus halophilus]